jgi:FixJ family two-component response regulator
MDEAQLRGGALLDERATVFVVEDDQDVSRYLVRLLESAGLDVEVYATGAEFLQRYTRRQLACALIDLRLPGLNGIELQRRLALRKEELPVILMTGFASASTAVEAMKLGAVDYIEKPIEAAELLATVRTALERDRAAKRRRAEEDAVAGMMARLTPRERQVLELVVAGHPSKDIAEILKLAKKTVDLHRSHIMSKLQADSVVDIVTMALTGHRARRARAS